MDLIRFLNLIKKCTDQKCICQTVSLKLHLIQRYIGQDYLPDSVYKDEMIDAIRKHSVTYQSVFIDSNTCQKNKTLVFICVSTYEPPKGEITISKINPTSYVIHMHQSEAKQPLLLIFQNTFNSGWKLSLDQNRT